MARWASIGRILDVGMRIVRYWLYFQLLHRRQSMAASGADQKHATFPMDFRSTCYNGHSRHAPL